MVFHHQLTYQYEYSVSALPFTNFLLYFLLCKWGFHDGCNSQNKRLSLRSPLMKLLFFMCVFFSYLFSLGGGEVYHIWYIIFQSTTIYHPICMANKIYILNYVLTWSQVILVLHLFVVNNYLTYQNKVTFIDTHKRVSE